MIKNIVLDIGNVLADYRWKEFLVDKGLDEAMIKRVAKASVATPAWQEFDRGALSEDEVKQMFVSNDPEIADVLLTVFNNIEGMVIKRDYAIPWIQSMKDAGLKVYYLSNYSKKAYDECRDSLDFMPLTDGGILSYRELIIKPEPEIYNLLCERYDLVPKECIFFDDTPVNVEAAKALGWNSFVFTTREQADADMRSLGVNI